MKMETVSKKHSTGKVNIPKEHLERSGIKKDDPLEIESEPGKITIRRKE